MQHPEFILRNHIANKQREVGSLRDGKTESRLALLTINDEL